MTWFTALVLVASRWSASPLAVAAARRPRPRVAVLRPPKRPPRRPRPCRPAGRCSTTSGGSSRRTSIRTTCRRPRVPMSSRPSSTVWSSFDAVTSEIKPGRGADSWESNADATVWTFHLKKGTKFPNGREVVGRRLRVCLEPGRRPEEQVRRLLPPVVQSRASTSCSRARPPSSTGVVAKDPYTLEVTLTYPWSSFPYVTGHPALSPGAEGGGRARIPRPSSTCRSATAPSRWPSPGSTRSTSRWWPSPDYYGDKPKIDGIDFTIFKDERDRLHRVQGRHHRLHDTSLSGQIKATEAQYGVSDIRRRSHRRTRQAGAPRTRVATTTSGSTTRTPASRRRKCARPSPWPSTARPSPPPSTRAPGTGHRTGTQGHRGLRAQRLAVHELRRRAGQGSLLTKAGLPERAGHARAQALVQHRARTTNRSCS